MICSNKDECTDKLPEKIPMGTSQNVAGQVLDKCGFTHSLDQKTSTIYALKRGRQKGLVIQSWSVEIKLDKARKVTAVKVGRVFTGP
jgi:hypothetical protein